MAKKNHRGSTVEDEKDELRNRLEEAEETLRAIRQYMVDAFVVSHDDDFQVITFGKADYLYRLMVESMNEGAVTLLPDGTIFYSNPCFAEMVQTRREDLFGLRFEDFILPKEQYGFDKFFKESRQVEQRREFCLVTPQTACIPVQLSLYPLSENEAGGTAVIITDISKRVQAEEALRKSESLFRLIATSSPDVIFAQDGYLRYTWIINPPSNLLPEQIIGKRDIDLFPREEAFKLTEIKQKVLETGISHKQVLSLSPGGIPRWYDAVYQPLYNEAQEITGLICYARDVTERMQAEEKIRSLASELILVEQEERHRISQILHDDLQQRLFAIRAHLSLLQDANGIEKIHLERNVNIEQIQDWLFEAIKITRNLSINLSPVVLQGDGLAEAVNWLASQMKEEFGLQVEVEVDEDFNQLEAHMRVLLFQTIRELLFNIVKHAEVREAKVSLSRENSLRRITVSDSGRGFDAAGIMQDRQAAHGLLIVKDRLGLMGCTMKIVSQPGNGTQVSVDIPLEKYLSS